MAPPEVRTLYTLFKGTEILTDQIHHLFHSPIADHSFSADKQTLAIARDTSVELYGREGNEFKLKDELKGHDKHVTSVDIALSSGRIVTCSQGKPQNMTYFAYN